MAFCPNCGTQLGDSVSFCPNCGTRKQATQNTQQSSQQYSPATQQPYAQYAPAAAPGKAAKKMSGLAKFFIIFTVLAVIAGVVVLLIMDPFNWFKSDEDLIRERIQAYEDACNNGDYEGMLDCMAPDVRSMLEGTMGIMDGLFSEGTGLGFGMTDMFGLSGAMGDYCNVEILSIDINGDRANVEIIMSVSSPYAGEQTQQAVFPMIKDGSDWYIGGVDNMLPSDLGAIYQY